MQQPLTGVATEDQRRQEQDRGQEVENHRLGEAAELQGEDRHEQQHRRRENRGPQSHSRRPHPIGTSTFFENSSKAETRIVRVICQSPPAFRSASGIV